MTAFSVRALQRRPMAVAFAIGAAGVFSMASVAAWAGEAKAPAPAPAAASSTNQDTAANNDPLEPLNRTISGFNRVVRKMLLNPMAEAYQDFLPPPAKKTISNVSTNLSEPVTAVSSALHGDKENAGNAMKRFVVNSTVGLGGTRDVATGMGIKDRKEDLGQAMGANGVKPGVPLVLPILGPSNVRDALGDAVTAIANPLPLAASAANGAVGYTQKKNAVEALDKNSLDPYVTERDAYAQHRAYQIDKDKGKAAAPTKPEDVPTIAAGD